MGYSELKQKLNSGEVDPNQKQELLREYEYFASIAPKPFLYGLRKKLAEGRCGVLALIAILAFILVPVMLVYAPAFFFVFILILFYVYTIRPKLGKREYKTYNFTERISEPALRLFDEKLSLEYHEESEDLVDENMKYQKALAEARLIRPIPDGCQEAFYGSCSYDWEDESDPDAFECKGMHLYTVHTDSDGHTDTTTYFDGFVFKFRTSFRTSGSVNVMSTKTKKTLFGREKEVNQFKKIKDRAVEVIDTENQEFAESFDTIATYEEEAYRFLSPLMIETLLRLREKYFFSLCLRGNVMTVSVESDRFEGMGQSCFASRKPTSRPNNPEEELEQKINDFRSGLMAICELKDMVSPSREYA